MRQASTLSIDKIDKKAQEFNRLNERFLRVNP
jgi:hypothetical protein